MEAPAKARGGVSGGAQKARGGTRQIPGGKGTGDGRATAQSIGRLPFGRLRGATSNQQGGQWTIWRGPTSWTRKCCAAGWRVWTDGARTSRAIFAPWFAFAALPEKDFPARAKELAAQFSTNQTAVRCNPMVAKAFAGEAPATMKDVADRYGNLLVEYRPTLGGNAGPDERARRPRPCQTPRGRSAARFFTRTMRRPICRAVNLTRLYDVPTGQKLRAIAAAHRGTGRHFSRRAAARHGTGGPARSP